MALVVRRNFSRGRWALLL